ncbi:MAG TPA: endo-1,3-alpha-glucanase family glycosylhydrolase [Planctomycetota bacterium]|jgi:formylglycine-generating enzyme required for sulfatase activity
MKANLRLLVAALGVLLVSIAGVNAADAPKPAATERLVLCWYMVCFGNSVDVYKQEIELAQRNGIDGFLLDVGAWEGNYIESTTRMYEAAKQLNTGFKLAMSPEYSVQPFPDKVRDMVLKFRDHPNQLRHDGKVVLSGYCGASMLPPAIEKLKADGVSVCLVPSVFLPKYIYRPSMESFVNEFDTTPVLDGLMMFNAVELGTAISDNAAARRATQARGKILGAGVIPAYNSANLQDYRGLSGYLSMWEGAIDDGADWISLVIWNDYNEDSALMPSRWPSGSERYLYDRDESLLNATAFASAWFKSGRQPTITQDKMFVTYRNRSKWMRKSWDGKQWVDSSLTSGRFDQIHDDVEDLVYVDTFLTAPASVILQLGKKDQRFEQPAGIGHAEFPMAAGVPHLTLERDKKVLADVIGRKEIVDQATERNSLLGYHHVNRTWISGTAIGPIAKRIEAESGALENGATLVTEGAVKAVQNTETKGSGFSVPVEGLSTATYNVRIVYCNPSTEEARLTLYADGPPRGKGDYPYFIPAYLPPTGKGTFQTVSFFWSLYDSTRSLKLQWQAGQIWGQPDKADDDHGVVLVDAIELVKVEPTSTPAKRDASVPEMILIPGGEFVMGSEKGEPDEKPRHSVKISSFAMGKYEVTNEEFERFDPTHRALRNGNSWRNREPVLHVSWLDAAKFCNWLSTQANLTPVYAEQAISPAKPNEKFWVANLTTDGYRLPTEAEWEYEGTGRGEGRTYPWGDDAPVPGVHGRFQLKSALGARLPRPASEEGGVVVVGSYPKGASRDGVMDLAGNVAEWCTDWYDYYTADAQSDPCQSKPGNFRVIRGGSWSWYSHSQRATDREFNSQNYPGHAYYGFRIVLPESGWKKLKKN